MTESLKNGKAAPYGPNSAAVVTYLHALDGLTTEQWRAARTAPDAAWNTDLSATRDTAWRAASDARLDAAWDAASVAVWESAAPDGPCDAARNAAQALVVRELIAPEQFATLTAPMRALGISPLN